MGAEFKSGDFASIHGYNFAKKLREACPSGARNFTQIFEDFCGCAANTIRQSMLIATTGKPDPEVEADYMRHVAPYKAEKTVAFSEAFAILVDGMEATVDMQQARVEHVGNKPLSGDFLGNVYEASGCSNPHSGQFFTPWAVSSAMARMILGDQKPVQGERFTIMEPAVGAGAMLLAAAEVLRENKFGPYHWWFTANDIDARCFHMAYIQLSLMGCPGVVRLGNSLSAAPASKAWVTPTGVMFPYRPKRGTEVDVANLPREAVEEAVALATAPEPPPGDKESPKPRKPRREAHSAPAEAVSAEQDGQLSLF